MFVPCVLGMDVFAGGGSGEGNTSDGNGSCYTNWWDTCYGMSWQKYKIVRALPKEGVHFYWTWNTDPNGPVQIKGCQVGQEVYNFGFTTYGYAGEGYQVSTQRRKGRTFTWHQGNKGAYEDSDDKDTTRGYLEGKGGISNTEVFNKYKAMIEYLKSHPNTPFLGDQSMDFENVGYFCFTPEAKKTVLYYSEQKVST